MPACSMPGRCGCMQTQFAASESYGTAAGQVTSSASMADRNDLARAVLAQRRDVQWLLGSEETSIGLLIPRALCIPPAAQQQCTQAAAALVCQAYCRLPDDQTLAMLLSSRSAAAAQLLQLYADASGDVLLESIRKDAQLLQLGLHQMKDSTQTIPGQVPAAALLTEPLVPPPAALMQPHVPGCLSCLVPQQTPGAAGASPTPSAHSAPTAAGEGLGLGSAAAPEAANMEGLEEGGAQDQVCDPSTVDQLCTSLQAAATSMDVSGVSVPLLLEQLGAAAAVGGVPQALQQQLAVLPEGVVQLLLQQAAAAGVETAAGAAGAGAAGSGVAVLMSASLLPLLLGMGAAGSPTLLACLVTAVELDESALVAGVLVPLLAAPSLKLGQVQLLVKLLKERPATGPGLLSALQQAVAGTVAAASLVSAAPSLVGGVGWQEPHVHLLQALLDACPGEVLPMTLAVLRSLQAAFVAPGGAQGLQKSVKLVQLLKSLVVKSCLGSADLLVLEEVVGSTQTFLTKGLLAQIRRLQAQEGS